MLIRTRRKRADLVQVGELLVDGFTVREDPTTPEGVPWLWDLRIVTGVREDGVPHKHSMLVIETTDGEVLTKDRHMVSVVDRHQAEELADRLGMFVAARRQEERRVQ